MAESIEPGRIYVAPPDCHLHVSDGHVRLTRGPKENGHRPALDPLFRTAALSYGPRVVGVVPAPERRHCRPVRIKQRGGLAIVQDLDPPLSRHAWSAIERVAVDHVLPVQESPRWWPGWPAGPRISGGLRCLMKPPRIRKPMRSPSPTGSDSRPTIYHVMPRVPWGALGGK